MWFQVNALHNDSRDVSPNGNSHQVRNKKQMIYSTTRRGIQANVFLTVLNEVYLRSYDHCIEAIADFPT